MLSSPFSSQSSFERQIIDANPSATILVDALADDMPIVYVNNAFTCNTGFSQAEVLGHNPRFMHGNETDQPGLQTIRDALRDQKPCMVTLRNFRKDGTLFYNEIRITPLYDDDGRVTHFLGVQNDVTTRIQQRDDLLRSEALYRSIITAMSDGVVLHAPDGSITTSNPAAAEILGLTTKQIAGRTPIDPRWKAIHEDGSPFPGETHPAMVTLRTGEPQSNVVMGVHRPDGALRWISISSRSLEAKATPHPKPDDTLADPGVVVTFTDITPIKDAERLRYQAALEQERLHVLSDFVRDAAHEFRTPLSTISTTAFAITLAEDPAYPALAVKTIEEQVEHISQLLDMMMKITRISSGPVAMTAVNLDSLVRQTCDIARTQFNRAIHIHTEATLPSIISNARLLQEALLALINNAHRFSPPADPIMLSTTARHDMVLLEVHDTGPGILPEHQPHIFDMFWRDDQAHSTPGLGLGLPMAQRIAALHGGTVSFTTTLGAGSVFTLSLPVVGV